MLSKAKFTSKAELIFEKHGPKVLFVIGISGMIGASIKAVQVTPKALMLLSDARYEKQSAQLTPVEKVKAVWKCYIPSVVISGLSIGCLAFSYSMKIKQSAVLATAYALSESALSNYQDKLREVVGEKKEKLVRDAVAKETLEKKQIGSEVFVTDRGNALCYDTISGRYFKSDLEFIKQAVNELNHRMLTEMYISLNDFYYEIRLSPTSIGDNLGWNIENGLIEITYSSLLASDGTPCLVMNYKVSPKYDYNC